MLLWKKLYGVLSKRLLLSQWQADAMEDQLVSLEGLP